MSAGQWYGVLLDFVREHPSWSAWVVFGLALFEAVPFVWVLVMGVGSIVCAADPILCWISIGSAAAGIACSDWFLYGLGHRYRDRVLTAWPLKGHAGLVEKARAFVRRWGGWAIVIGRVSGPVRPVVPVIAGLSEMSFVRFQLLNWSSALVFAAVLLSPGAGIEAVWSARP